MSLEKSNRRKSVFPKISVLMPAYNAGLYINEAILSIVHQTYVDFELLILDDCSTDDTFGIAKMWEKNDSRITVFRNEKNLGIPQSRNKLISLSNGEFIAWADADDISMPCRFEAQANVLENNSHIGICGAHIELFNNFGFYKVRHYPSNDQEIRNKLFRYVPLALPTVMVRKSVLTEIGLFDSKYCTADDLDMLFRIAGVCAMANCPEILVRYRIHENSVTKKKIAFMVRETFAIRKKYKNINSFSYLWKDAVWNFLSRIAYWIIPGRVLGPFFSLFRDSKKSDSKRNKILISPANYIVDENSVSEFYYSGTLLRELALADETNEYHVLCGFCPNPASYPVNIRIHCLWKNGNFQLTVWRRISFYAWIFAKSISLSFQHAYRALWHQLPNGASSFNPFLFFRLYYLFGIKKVFVGRLSLSYGEKYADIVCIDSQNRVTIKHVKEPLLSLIYRIGAYCRRWYYRAFGMALFYNITGLQRWIRSVPSIGKITHHIIPVGVDVKLFDCNEKKRGKAISLLYVGNLIERKRPQYAITVLNAVRLRGANVRLVVVGDGYLLPDLKKMVAELHLESYVSFAGFVKKTDVPAFYSCANFCILPSQEEAFGHVLLESWVSRTVFIGSKLSTFLELVEDGKNGLLCAFEDSNEVENLAKKIVNMTEAEFATMVDNAYRGVQRFAWPIVAKEYRNAINTFIHS